MKVYIKDTTGAVVREIDVSGQSERSCERIVRGLLHQMNREDYFVDDSEVDEHFAAEAADA